MVKRIALATHFFSTHGGGVEKVAAELAIRLAETHGWEVTWIASDTDKLPDQLPPSVQLVPAKSWNVIERFTGMPWPIWFPSALRNLWSLIGRVDLVHIHDVLYFGNFVAWGFAKLRGVPVVVTQHISYVPFRSSILRRLYVVATRTAGRLVLSNSSQVVFISSAVCDEFKRFCKFKNPPIYLPNGVDTNIFTKKGPEADDPLIISSRQEGKHVLLFVGRFLEKKGLYVLRELASKFSDVLWIFAGWGPVNPEYWGLPNVHVVRGASGAKLASYYRSADLLILPSFSEAFPLVVQEAMACGTPVMVGEDTAAGCPAAQSLMYVEKVGSGDTVARWAQKLALILDEKELLNKKRMEVAEFARKNWSWDAAAEEYARVFSRVVQNRN